MNICGLVLAAGGSSRLGKPKQLVRTQGKTLLEQSIEHALQTSLQKVYVVLGARHLQVKSTVKHLGVTFIYNEQWQEGIGSSISTGVHSLCREGNYDAVLIMLCDQLHINSTHLQALIDAYGQKKSSIVATTYGGQSGVPALFGHEHFSGLEKLSGDTGAKRILHHQAGSLHSIPFEQALIDIDTPEDLLNTGLS